MAPQTTHRTTSGFETQAAEAAWAARWEWQRLADRAAADRAALVTDQVWQQGYLLAYRDAYTRVGYQVAAAATHAAAGHPDARPTLTRLAAAALAAGDQASTAQPTPPPADRHTLDTATTATATNRQQPWKPLAHTAWAGSLAAGTIAGTVTAATDIVIGWRSRGGHRLAGDATVEDRPASTWIADLLAGINRDTVTTAPGRPAARSAAQLAGEDQAADAPAPTTAPVAGRRDRTASAASAAAARSR